MIIPMTKGTQPQAAQPQPSQTDLLMALAMMHKDGRFAKPQPNPKAD
jgi:hypothetical protein